jgi:hypothetical protein
MIDAQSFLGPDASEIFGERTRPRVQRLTPRQPQPGAPPRSTENLTNFIKNPSTGKPSEPIVNNDSLATCAISADGMTAQFPPKVCCVNYYPSTGCKKIQPNLSKYRVFGTPGGTPLFYPLSLTISGQKPLCRNAFLNSSFKIKHSKLPQFTPKNTRFFAPTTFQRYSIALGLPAFPFLIFPFSFLIPLALALVNHRQPPSSAVKRRQPIS